jgi:hypothetical protein
MYSYSEISKFVFRCDSDDTRECCICKDEDEDEEEYARNIKVQIECCYCVIHIRCLKKYLREHLKCPGCKFFKPTLSTVRLFTTEYKPLCAKIQQFIKRFDLVIYRFNLILRYYGSKQEDKKVFLSNLYYNYDEKNDDSDEHIKIIGDIDISEMENGIDNKDEACCNICLISKPDCSLIGCGHFFHRFCILKWWKKNKCACTSCMCEMKVSNLMKANLPLKK